MILDNFTVKLLIKNNQILIDLIICCMSKRSCPFIYSEYTNGDRLLGIYSMIVAIYKNNWRCFMGCFSWYRAIIFYKTLILVNKVFFHYCIDIMFSTIKDKNKRM